MRKLKCLLSALLIVMLMVLSTGCYIVNGQKMWRVKGTYELTHYTFTNGKTDTVTDYIAEKGYKVYLVVTGNGTGYYVHKDDETEAYYREVSLS